MQPIVSIICITYNHENYIREAIEGFLNQIVDFPIEIIIHDDASTDSTANIICEYASIHKDKIKPILQKENQKSKGLGIVSRTVFNAAQGKYIALCEGDDYWTDPYKLSKQICFLEANDSFSGAAHQSIVTYADNSRPDNLFRIDVPEIITIDNLLEDRLFHTASFIFRTNIIKQTPYPQNITAGDRALILLVASFGQIHYNSDIMCCYRKNESGVSTWVTSKMMKKDLNIVPWLASINPKFPKHRYIAFIHLTILKYPKHLSKITTIKHSYFYIYHSFYNFPKNLKSNYRFLLYEFPKLWQKTRQSNQPSR